tara:strand:- start:2053 stop:2325 length:273 start_codon:yes stop_codon:yes gene_type:complete
MFNPVNRYILIDIPTSSDADRESLIVLPDDYKAPEERYIQVAAIKSADDVRFAVIPQSQIVVDRSMIEEISIGATNYNIILDNYVVGIID